MKLTGLLILDEFVETHVDAKSWIENWVSDVDRSTWQTPQDIENNYSSASFLKDRHVFFNVKGNKYRLLVQVAYNAGVVAVKWVGTHAEYDKRKFP